MGWRALTRRAHHAGQRVDHLHLDLPGGGEVVSEVGGHVATGASVRWRVFFFRDRGRSPLNHLGYPLLPLGGFGSTDYINWVLRLTDSPIYKAA